MWENISPDMSGVIQKYHNFSEGQFDNMHQQTFKKCMFFVSAITFLRIYFKQVIRQMFKDVCMRISLQYYS